MARRGPGGFLPHGEQEGAALAWTGRPGASLSPLPTRLKRHGSAGRGGFDHRPRASSVAARPFPPRAFPLALPWLPLPEDWPPPLGASAARLARSKSSRESVVELRLPSRAISALPPLSNRERRGFPARARGVPLSDEPWSPSRAPRGLPLTGPFSWLRCHGLRRAFHRGLRGRLPPSEAASEPDHLHAPAGTGPLRPSFRAGAALGPGPGSVGGPPGALPDGAACLPAAGGAGGGLRPDSLPGRLHPGRAGHEDQPDRGPRAGKGASAFPPPASPARGPIGTFGQRKEMKPICHFHDAL